MAPKAAPGRRHGRHPKAAQRFHLGIENVADENDGIGQGGILTIADPLTLKLSTRFDF